MLKFVLVSFREDRPLLFSILLHKLSGNTHPEILINGSQWTYDLSSFFLDSPYHRLLNKPLP
jgi:hypothetical protein